MPVPCLSVCVLADSGSCSQNEQDDALPVAASGSLLGLRLPGCGAPAAARPPPSVQQDAVVAADALVALGLAAEIELESSGHVPAPPTQQQQQQPRGSRAPGQAPPRRRTGSQQRSVGQRQLLDPNSSRGFLPWEQLLAGIQAIKAQGPPLFQQQSQSSSGGAQQRPPPPPPCRPAAAGGGRAPLQRSASSGKFGQLMELVARAAPGIGLHSRTGSTSSSSTVSCQLPLFLGCSVQSSPHGGA